MMPSNSDHDPVLLPTATTGLIRPSSILICNVCPETPQNTKKTSIIKFQGPFGPVQ